MEGSEAKERSLRLPFVVLPALAVLVHLVCAGNYGYFRDELYYLACAHRLDWGYVDHPPFSIALLRLVTVVFGDSLFAIRTPLALASGATVLTVMAAAKRLGAGSFGVSLAGLAVLLSGMYLVIFSVYSMNGLEILIWAVSALLVVRLLESDSTRDWVLLGVVAGVGFLNKASVLWMVGGLGVGLLVSPHRKLLSRPGPWIAVGILAAFAAPNMVWQATHNWPTAEFADNALKTKLMSISAWEFLAQQAVVMNLVALPLIVAGVVHGLKADGRKWSVLPIVFLVVATVLMVKGRSRVNYLAPAYPFVLALGGVAVEKWAQRKNVKPVYAYIAFALTAPFYMTLGLPWLPPERLSNLITKSPVQPPVEEVGPKSPMQGWADMFGWPELSRDVGTALAALPETDRRDAVVVTKNYGEAAALEHFGDHRVICGHNNYWLWGPDGWDGRVAVFVNHWPPEVTSMFQSFEQVGKVNAPYAVPEQNGSPIWIARGLKVPVAEFWKTIKKFV